MKIHLLFIGFFLSVAPYAKAQTSNLNPQTSILYDPQQFRKTIPAGNTFLQKRLLLEFYTYNHRFANFEGMCMPYPGWLLLIADSQDQQAGLLRDWFRLVRL